MDNMPTPMRHSTGAMKKMFLGFCFDIPHDKNGTITTFVAVKKALFDGVEYIKPKVWTKNAVNKSTPITIPPFKCDRLKFFRILFAKIRNMSTAAIANLPSMIADALRAASSAS